MNPKLQQAIETIKAGDKKTGRELLIEVMQSDPDNETAWLWMGIALNTPEKKQRAFQRVLEINPNNETAKRQLKALIHSGNKPVSRKKWGCIGPIFIVLLACLFLSFLSSALSGNFATDTLSSTDTPRPEPTKIPEGAIPITRRALVQYFEQNHSFTWRSNSRYNDGTYQWVGVDVNERRKLVLWSEPDNEENLKELFFSFRFELDPPNADAEIDAGNGGLLDTLALVLPNWEGGVDWVKNAYAENNRVGELVTGKGFETETRVNGLTVLLEIGYENPTGDMIVILSIWE